MRKDFIGFLFMAFILVSCLSTDFDTMEVQSDYDIIYLDNLSQKSDFSNDPYRIISITPYGDQWDVVVEYSGGCGEHLFYIWWDGIFRYSEPPQFDLYLIHNGNQDLCEAIIRDTINFSLQNALNDQALEVPFVATMHNETRAQSIVIDSEIAKLTTDACDLNSEITRQNCSLGALDNLWIRPQSDTQSFDNVLLQPVRLGRDSTILAAQPGKAAVSVTVLFGFEYATASDFNQACSAWPEGTIVPVTVNCIQPL